MPYKKGTPEYEAWKNSSEYKIWCEIQSKKAKKTFSGKSKSPEQREKMSKAANGRVAWNKGKKYTLSEEMAKQKSKNISNTLKNKYSQMTDEERFNLTSAARNSQNYIDTKPERFFEMILKEKGIIYEKQKRISINGRNHYRVDFYVPDKNVIYEIQGCYHHACEKCGYSDDDIIYGVPAKLVRDIDLKRTAYIKSLGYHVKWIWEHDIKALMKEQEFEQ